MSGISVLRDRNLSWSSRLLKASQMFIDSHTSSYIPRKEQVLIDWLLFSIHSVSSKSSGDDVWSADETSSAWSLLVDIFRCKEVKRLSENGGSILLPVRFYKDVMTTLLRCDSDTGEQVLSCLHMVSTMSCFKTFSYLPIDTLVELVSACCQYSTAHPTAESTDQVITPTLHLLLGRISELAKRRTLPLPTLLNISQRLFTPPVLRNRKLNKSVCKDMVQTTLNVLICKESLKHFDKFIKMKSGENKSSGNLNFVGVMFTALETGLASSEEQEREEYSNIMSLMFEKYLALSSTSADSRQGHLMDRFGMLYFLLGMAERLSNTETLYLWSQLFAHAAKYEIHNPTSDTSAKETTSLAGSVGQLLNKYKNNVTDSWYSCMTSLLEINHRCLDKQLSSLLTTAWLLQPNHRSSGKSLLLIHLLDTYSRMRQLPKLINLMMECVLESTTPVCLPPQAIHRLGEVIRTCPSSVCYDIWVSVYPRLLRELDSVVDDKGARRCMVVSDMLYNVMYHMKMYDSSVPLAVKHKLQKEMVNMQSSLTNSISSLKECEVKVAELRCPVLSLLAEASTAVVILLYRYIDSREIEGDCLQPSFTLIQEVLSLPAYKQPRLPSVYLTLVKVYSHQIALAQMKVDDHIMDTIETSPILTSVLSTWSSVSKPANYKEAWYNSVVDIEDSNIGNAILHYVTNSSLSTYMALSDEHRDEYAKLLVSAAFCNPADTAPVDRAPTDGYTTASVLDKYLHSWSLTQLPVSLHRKLTDEAIAKIATVLFSANRAPTPRKGKKRKLAESVSCDTSVMSEYISSLTHCLNNTNRGGKAYLTAVHRLYEQTSQLLNHLSVPVTKQHIQSIDMCVDILESMTGEGMSTSSSVTLPSMLLLLLKYLCQDTHHLKVHRSTMTSLIKLLARCLSDDKPRQLLEYLSLENIVEFLSSIGQDMLHDRDLVVRPLVNMILNGCEDVIKSSLRFLSKVFADAGSKLWTGEGISLQWQVIVGVATSALKARARSRNVSKAVMNWATKTTEQLCAYIDSEVTSTGEETMCTETLLWLSAALDVNMTCKELSTLVSYSSTVLTSYCQDPECLSTSKAEAILSLLTSVYQHMSTSTSQRAASRLVKRIHHGESDLWMTLTSLSSLLEHTSCYSTLKDLVAALVHSWNESTLSQRLQDLHSTMSKVSLEFKDEMTQSTSTPSLKWTNVVLMMKTVIACDSSNKEVIERHCTQFVHESSAYLCSLTSILETKEDKHLLVHLLSLLTEILSKGKAYSDSQGISGLLASLHLISFSTDVYRVDELLQPLSSLQKLLAAILLHHQLSANNNLSTYSSLTNKLVDTIIAFSDQNNRTTAVDVSHVESEILCCCQEIHKMTSLLSNYPNIFGKVSAYIICQIIHSLQSVTLLPNVKKALYPCFNGLFDLLDDHSSMMLKTNLGEAHRQIFKTMYSEWEKYHKYTGKV